MKTINRNTNDDKAWEAFIKTKSLNSFGKIILYTKAAKWYRNGTFFSPSFKWWHPITWVYILINIVLLIPSCMLSDASAKDFLKQLWEDLTVDEYFKKNPDELRWYKP